MRFKVIINKNANFYFFVQNLSRWHFSCRNEYNIYWQKITGNLSMEEIAILKKFKKIRLKFPVSKSIFEHTFFVSKNPMYNLKSKLSIRDYELVNKTFSLFKNKFDIIYKKDLIKLKKWKKLLERKINENNLNRKINKTLSHLYNNLPSQNKILVYLLISSKNLFGGGANIDNRSITIEISNLQLNKFKKVLGIIWHEIIHLLYDKKFFMNLIKVKYSKKKKIISKIREIAAYSLFPEGILAKKFLNIPLGNAKYFGRYGNKAKNYFKIINEYINHNKKIDNVYVKKIIKNN